MFEELLPLLIDQWMSEKKALIYLAVLQIGSAPASLIAFKTGIKRVTAYSLLKEMEGSGIAYSIEKKWTTYFQVVNPQQLIKKLETKLETLQSRLPELLALTDIYKNKPKIQYFDGLSGVKEMYNDLLESKTEILSFLSLHEVDEELKQYMMNIFLPKRLAAWVFAKVLIPQHSSNEDYIALDEQYLKKSKIINEPLFDMQVEINLYGPDKVSIALFSSEEMSAIIIHSPKLYKSLLGIFYTIRNNVN